MALEGTGAVAAKVHVVAELLGGELVDHLRSGARVRVKLRVRSYEMRNFRYMEKNPVK